MMGYILCSLKVELFTFSLRPATRSLPILLEVTFVQIVQRFMWFFLFVCDLLRKIDFPPPPLKAYTIPLLDHPQFDFESVFNGLGARLPPIERNLRGLETVLSEGSCGAPELKGGTNTDICFPGLLAQVLLAFK